MSGHRPARWLERILEWALPGGLSGESTLGDLAEDFERMAVRSALRAHLWYAGQTASIVGYRLVSGSGVDSPDRDSDLFMDLRWTLRSMIRRPGFAFGVVAVLGLGLGANVAVFSVVDGTVKNSSWWADADRTFRVWPEREWSFGNLGWYEEEQTAYRTVGEYVELALALRSADGTSQSVNGVLITPSLFQELAVQPIQGRALVDDDAFIGVEPVVVMGEGLWRRSFGADPDIIGSTVDINGAAIQVVGIQGVGGRAPGGDVELWIPLVMDPRDDDYFRAVDKTMVGVLRDGATQDDAQNELDAFGERLSGMFPAFYPPEWAAEARVAPADESQRRMISTPLLLLLAGTALLMLVTALNVGNLLLGRAIDRRKELAVRASLGAGRGRIVRQLLVEGGVLTLLGLAAGTVSAAFGSQWIARLFVEQPVVAASPITSPAVLTFALVVAGMSWIVLNGVPVLHFLRAHGSGLTVSPDSGAGVQRSLVTVQAALATLLLVSATLLVATVDNLRSLPLGFDARDMVAVELSPPEDRVGSSTIARELYSRLVTEAEALPGVTSAGLTAHLPLRGTVRTTGINLESDPKDPREAQTATFMMVDPGFFEVFDLDPIQGRVFDGTDIELDTASAIVVSESLAELLWPGGNAIGQRVAIDPHAWDNYKPVVGVVPDLRTNDMTTPLGPALYVSLQETPARDVTLVLRTDEGASRLAPVIRTTVRDVDPLVPIRSIANMQDVVRASYATSWILMGLLILMALLATGLGTIGIYAVLAHHVALNRRAIGVRMALGAQPGVVVGGVVRSGLMLAGIGIVIGCLGAAMSNRYLESVLFEVSTLSPVAFLAPAAALLVAAVVAAWIPAARAGRLPPAEVLRSD